MIPKLLTAADLLRQAAAEMRRRAQSATPGPWHATTGYPHLVCQNDGEGMVSTNLADKPAEDAEHIALWHPAVALAVADLLQVISWMPSSADPTDMQAALAVARAVLGAEAVAC